MSHSGVTATEVGTAERTRQVKRITWIGLVINVLLSVGKFVCGLLGSSQAVVADAIHSLSDMSTDIAVLVGVRYWSAPADEDHPYGHGRIEALVTSFISALLFVVAIGLVYRAIVSFKEPHSSPPGWIAFWAAAVSIVCKEGLYRWTRAVGRRIKSSAVIANAWHHRSDALSSLPVAVAVAVARAFPSLSFIDHVGSIVVSVFILRAAWGIGYPVLKQLIDTGAPAEARREIRRIALGIEGVEVVHAVRTRYVGTGLQVDLHVQVDGKMSVRKGHDISEEVKRRLLADGPDLVDVVVHLEPIDRHGESHESSVFLSRARQEPTMKRPRILFLCTGNSCRSQMAEGWARHIKADRLEAWSAGIETHGLNPRAVKAMAEAGVDISGQRSKHVDELKDVQFDYVVTVCGHANENCPVFPGRTRVIHVGFDDPPKLAEGAATEEEAMAPYRRVRDQIRAFVEELPDRLLEDSTQ